MSEITVRSLAKAMLPEPFRQLLRGCLNYAQRVGRWPIILWQIRGATWPDQWMLLQSALSAPFLSLENMLEWQDPILLGGAQVKVRGVGEFFVRARCDDLWHVLPWREHAIAAELRAKLRPGDIFIDAGANIGVYSVLAAQLVGPQGKVIAVEMMPDTADRLELNIALNKTSNITVCRAALSNVAGQVVTAIVTPGKYGQASIAKESDEDSAERIEVKTTTLDELARHLTLVHLMKMDLEGAELPAMQGGRELLTKTDYIIYESWGMSRRAENPVDAHLTNAGFSLSILDGNNWLASRDGTQLSTGKASH